MAKKPKINSGNMNGDHVTVHTVRIPLWPYLVAPLFCLVALPATWGAHRAYGTSATSAGWTGVAITCASIGILLITFFLSRPRGVVMQVMATFNAGLGVVWCIPAILEGPFTGPKLGFWLLFTLLISFDCALYRIMRQARGDDGNGQILPGELGELGDAVKQLKGATFGRPVIEGARVSTAIEMPPGRTFSEVAAVRDNVASLLDVRGTALRTIPDPDSERRGTLSAVPVDQLRVPRPDPGIEHGLSIADPITLGVAENGSLAQVILPGDPKANRNAVGVMCVVGMSGSGKTELLLRFVKEAAARVDNVFFVIDTRKGGQLPGWLKRAAKKSFTGEDAALDFMDSLEKRIAERSEWLGSRGFKQWVRGCGLPYETYVIFEAAGIIRDSNIVDLSETVRSVGMGIVLELQRATYDRLPVSARANITTWVTMGVQRPGDAEGALSPEMVEAGAAPDKWGNHHPGYFYLQWGGRPPELWAAPCRSFEPQDEVDREREVSDALGWDRSDDDLDDDDQPATDAPRGRPESDDDEPEQEQEEGPPPGVDPNDPPDPTVDPFAPMETPDDMPRIQFGDGSNRKPMLTTEALDLLRSHVRTLQQAKIPHIMPSDLSDVLAQTGLSASWLRNALKQLCAEGVLRLPRPGERGVYRIVQQERVGADA